MMTRLHAWWLYAQTHGEDLLQRHAWLRRGALFWLVLSWTLPVALASPNGIPLSELINTNELQNFVLIKMGWGFFLMLYLGFGALIFLCALALWIISMVFNWDMGRNYAFKAVIAGAIYLVIFPIVGFLLRWIRSRYASEMPELTMPSFGGG